MAYPASIRSLMAGSGTVSIAGTVGRPAILTFSQSQHFFSGETVRVTSSNPNLMYTIDQGVDKVWYSQQNLISGDTVTNGAFRRTNTSNSRDRSDATLGNYWVGRARHYFYMAYLDNNGNADCYYYTDTVAPVKGKHPYTGDRWSGSSWFGNEPASQNFTTSLATPVTDAANRVAALDGQVPVLSR